MIWTFVGPIVLLATMFISRWLGDLEAFTAGYVNGTTIRRPPSKLEGVSNFRSQIKVRFIDPTTWTGVIYLFAQFPIGIAAFVGLVTVYTFVGALTFAPLGVQLTDHFVDVALPWGIDIAFNTLPGSFILVPFGLLGFVLASHLILAFSSLHGWWAKMMLGSRSNRVSSRPAPAPEGDDPPRPSTNSEPENSSASLADVQEPNIESAPNDAADSPKPLTELGSPETAALTPFTPVPFSPAADVQPEVAPNTAAIAELTAREQEVFMLMAHGDTNADIAEELFISEGTVKTHVKRVLSKLYMRDRTQVVVFAYEKHLVVPGVATSLEATDVQRSYGG